MSRSRKHGAAEEAGGDERWLLTYADMITLLMALFMVLFSISSVNISKVDQLQESLKAAFSGSFLPGGQSILQSGQDSESKSQVSSNMPEVVALDATVSTPGTRGLNSAATQSALLKEAQQSSQENSDFSQLQYRLNQYAKAHGFANQVKAQIEQQGLVVTVLTDKLLFPSGQDNLLPASYPLLDEVATLINLDKDDHPVVVEGYTDDIPIHNASFQSNWWLSSARANNVNQYLLSRDVPSSRMSVAGYGSEHAVASNATPGGQAQNRRVEIVFQRKYPTPDSGA